MTPNALDKRGLRNYMMVLMLLKFSPHEVTEKVRHFIALSLTPITNIGYTSLGHGYGEITSLACHSSSLLRVNGSLHTINVSDTISRNYRTNDVMLNNTQIGSENDVVYGRIADYSVQFQATTPGW